MVNFSNVAQVEQASREPHADCDMLTHQVCFQCENALLWFAAFFLLSDNLCGTFGKCFSFSGPIFSEGGL